MAESVCVCGHAKLAHQHLRHGTDCAVCPAGACTRYRSAGSPVARLSRWVGERRGRGRDA